MRKDTRQSSSGKPRKQNEKSEHSTWGENVVAKRGSRGTIRRSGERQTGAAGECPTGEVDTSDRHPDGCRVKISRKKLRPVLFGWWNMGGSACRGHAEIVQGSCIWPGQQTLRTHIFGGALETEDPEMKNQSKEEKN